jgi:hypothetical protein
MMVQFAQVGRDRREIIRDPTSSVLLTHGFSLLATMLLRGAAMFLISSSEDPPLAGRIPHCARLHSFPVR